MQPIVIQPEGASPPFEADPIAWFAWAAARIEHGEPQRVVRERPAVFDLTEIGRAMIEERHLPHDNLRFLFGRDDFGRDDYTGNPE